MRAYDAFWGSALGVFLLSAVVSAAMMGPPSRTNRFLDADLAEAIAGPATAVALLIGVLVVALPLPPRRSPAATAETLAITVAILVAAIGFYRAAAGTDDGRGLDEEAVSAWLLATVGMLVLLTVVAVRANRTRKRHSRRRRR